MATDPPGDKPVTLDPDLVRKFLTELARSLDIGKTTKKLRLTDEESRRLIEAAIEALPAKRPARAGKKPELPLLADLDAGLLGGPATATLHIHVDGASRGNPGQAGAGAVLATPNGEVVRRLRRYLGVRTNNVAEYEALIMALEAAAAAGAEKVSVFADSELMVKQINGVYRVKSRELKPLYEKAMKLLDGFKSRKIAHVYREKNKDADRLANEAIDRSRAAK